MNKMQSEFDQIVSARWKSIFKRLPLEGLISNAFFFDAISFNYMYETHSSLIS